MATPLDEQANFIQFIQKAINHDILSIKIRNTTRIDLKFKTLTPTNIDIFY